MRIPTAFTSWRIGLGPIACAAAFAQTTAGVDWTAIEKRLRDLTAAVQARDIQATQKMSSTLWQFTVGEMVKQSPGAADRLQDAELLVAKRPSARAGMLPRLAMLSAEAGDWSKAESYARETLRTPSDVYDSVHAGNVVLGLVALRRNDIVEAEARLLAAAESKGKRLSPFGPNLALARALLEKGRNDVVLQYFQTSKSFATKNPRLDDWIAMLKGGRAPDLRHEYLWH
jgi:hypothetical protein